MISVVGLSKSYQNQKVVDNVSFTVPSGKVFGFLGQNGAGKTTTIKMMVGITNPDSGSVTVGGHSSLDISAKEKIGFMPEAPYFYDRLTGLEFMQFCNNLFHKNVAKSDNELMNILKEVGIGDAKNNVINTYSKGMKQRLGFAQTMVNDPEYVFLDEPLDGLDPIGRKEIKDIIKKLKSRGKTVFFNSHILWDIEELCDEIGVIHRGKLLYAGSAKSFCDGRPLEESFVSLIENLRSK